MKVKQLLHNVITTERFTIKLPIRLDISFPKDNQKEAQMINAMFKRRQILRISKILTYPKSFQL